MNRKPDFDTIKTEIRTRVRAALAAMTPQQKAAESAAICERLAKLELYQKAHVVMVFAPMSDEPLIEPFAQHALARGKMVLLPRIDPADKVMTGALVQSWPGDLERDPMGFLTPRFDAPSYDPASIHMVIVPGVAFSSTGVRLGRGGGYYDRYLPQIPIHRRIGVCYRCQQVETIPLLEHDEPVSDVITG
ncbi:MAG: 5-formyltetrahydrofolate cyclo-ligase [Phycisphaerales bacterium]